MSSPKARLLLLFVLFSFLLCHLSPAMAAPQQVPEKVDDVEPANGGDGQQNQPDQQVTTPQSGQPAAMDMLKWGQCLEEGCDEKGGACSTIHCPLRNGDGGDNDDEKGAIWLEQIFFKPGIDPRRCNQSNANNEEPFSFVFCHPKGKKEDGGEEADCSQEDGMTICFESHLDPSNPMIHPKMAVENAMVDNAVTRKCNPPEMKGEDEGKEDDKNGKKDEGKEEGKDGEKEDGKDEPKEDDKDGKNGILPNQPDSHVAKNVDIGALNRWEKRMMRKHGFQVTSMADGRFRVTTSFTNTPFYYDVGEGNCLLVEMLRCTEPDPFLTHFYATTTPVPTPVSSDREEEGKKEEGEDEKKKEEGKDEEKKEEGKDEEKKEEGKDEKKNVKKLKMPTMKGLANGVSLNAECFRGPWLLGLDMFLDFTPGFYLKIVSGTKPECEPRASYKSTMIMPKEEACKVVKGDQKKEMGRKDGVVEQQFQNLVVGKREAKGGQKEEMAEDGQEKAELNCQKPNGANEWKVANVLEDVPEEYRERMLIEDGQWKVVFVPEPHDNDWVNLTFAVPEQHRLVVIGRPFINSNCEEAISVECREHINSFMFMYNQGKCRVLYGFNKFKACMSVNGTEDTFEEIETMQDNEPILLVVDGHKAHLEGAETYPAEADVDFPAEDCAVQNMPIREFGQVHSIHIAPSFGRGIDPPPPDMAQPLTGKEEARGSSAPAWVFVQRPKHPRVTPLTRFRKGKMSPKYVPRPTHPLCILLAP